MLRALTTGEPMRLVDIKPLQAILGIAGGCTVLLVILLSIKAMEHRPSEVAPQAQALQAASTPNSKFTDPAQLIKQAKACLEDPSPDHFNEAEIALNRVPSSAPESKEAAHMRASIPAARLKYRSDIAHDLQESYCAAGKNVKVTLTGPGRENVQFLWAGLTMTDVSRMQGAFGTLRDFRDSGCKTFTMTDGIGINQQIDLTTLP